MNDGIKGAKVWYLFHSGFAVKTKGHFLIFDYYLDTAASGERSLDAGVINPEEIKDADVVVFSSHKHGDHFNPVILSWAKEIKKIRYVLSRDIKSKRITEEVSYVHPGNQYDLGDMNITVLKSTDAGGAFLVHCDGLTIYHAGDLNWWHWIGEPEGENKTMGINYKKQIDTLKGERIHLAFVPVDPRLEGTYLWGLDYFMQTVGANKVFPMHFGEDYSIFEWLKQDERAAGYLNKIVEISRRGERFL